MNFLTLLSTGLGSDELAGEVLNDLFGFLRPKDEEALVSTGEPANEFWGGYGGILGRRLDGEADRRRARGYGSSGGYGRGGRRLDDEEDKKPNWGGYGGIMGRRLDDEERSGVLELEPVNDGVELETTDDFRNRRGYGGYGRGGRRLDEQDRRRARGYGSSGGYGRGGRRLDDEEDRRRARGYGSSGGYGRGGRRLDIEEEATLAEELGEERRLAAFPYRGRWPGYCNGDGLYVHDWTDIFFCSNGAQSQQKCAPGTRHSQELLLKLNTYIGKACSDSIGGVTCGLCDQIVEVEYKK